MGQLNATEMGHFAALAKLCSKLLSRQGCNDFLVPNTADNWALAEREAAWNLSLPVEEWRKHPDYRRRPKRGELNITDFSLFLYLVARITEAT